MTTLEAPNGMDEAQLKARIRSLGQGLGFDAIGFADIDLREAEAGLAEWLRAGFHGEMNYMARHGPPSSGGTGLRTQPASLLPGTCSVITVSRKKATVPHFWTRMNSISAAMNVPVDSM